MRDVTLGQYYPADSPLHRLDPRVKLIGTLLFIILAFVAQTFIGLALIAAFMLSMALISKVPLKALFKGLKTIYILLAFTFLMNLFFSNSKSDHVLLKWGFIVISREGLIRAAFMAVRLILLVTGASLMTLTTSPIALTDGMERLMSPLAKIGFPAHETAMMMSIALRFIPTLMEEADRIMKAQAARGAGFSGGGLIKKAKAVIPIIIPLFVSAIRRAEELAMAMTARCYHGGEGRTRLNVLAFKRRDLYAGLILLAFTLIITPDNIFIKELLPFLARP